MGNGGSLRGYFGSNLDKLSALLENQNSNSNRVLKSGDIYQIEFINNDFTNNITDPFRCEKTFYDTSDKPSVRLAHKDFIIFGL